MLTMENKLSPRDVSDLTSVGSSQDARKIAEIKAVEEALSKMTKAMQSVGDSQQAVKDIEEQKRKLQSLEEERKASQQRNNTGNTTELTASGKQDLNQDSKTKTGESPLSESNNLRLVSVLKDAERIIGAKGELTYGMKTTILELIRNIKLDYGLDPKMGRSSFAAASYSNTPTRQLGQWEVRASPELDRLAQAA